jgi:hypothetical protein
MKDCSSIQVGEHTITYEVVRSQRRKKTIQTQITADSVRVLAPADTSDGELERLLRKQADWIVDRLKVFADRPGPRRFVSGETMPYLGEDLPLNVNSDRFLWPWIRLENEQFLFDAPPRIEEEERRDLIRNAFVEWYWRKAEEYLPGRVDHWLPFVAGQAGPKVLIRDQRSRWGSCAWDGTLRFNWRLIMLHPELVDLVVVHELSHLIFRNHSPDFWDHVGFFLPDFKERRRRLKAAGLCLPI